MFRLLVILVCAFASAGMARAEIGEKAFRERAKCAVAVKYSIELEEDRRQVATMGMVADSDGTVIVPASEIPLSLRHDELKDFKIHFFGGDPDGYSAEYLGADSLSGTHFLKLKKGLPDGLVPYTSFARAGVSRGQTVWGAGISREEFLFEPYLLKSYVSDIGRRPVMKAASPVPVAAVGTAVFDESGKFVGWGDSPASELRLLYAEKINGLPITLAAPVSTDSFILPDELDKILARRPSRPEGDKFGWLGLVNTKVLKRDVAKMMGVGNASAFLISDIAKGSPAETAGLKKGDIVVAVDGKSVEVCFEQFALYNFRLLFAEHKKGDKISLSVIRAFDSPRKVEVVVGENPKTHRESKTKYFKRIGFSVREYLFDDAVARKNLEIKTDAPPVIKYVKPNSPAASALPARLFAGDIVREINSKPVSSYAEAVAELAKLDASAKEIVILAEDMKETKLVRIKLD